MPSGDCYEANGSYMLNQSMFDGSDYLLCHGIAILTTDGKPFGHCWLEKGNMVLDFSNGNAIAIDRKKYYKLGGMPVKGYKTYKYNFKEMRKKIVDTGHWGPWDSKPPR